MVMTDQPNQEPTTPAEGERIQSMLLRAATKIVNTGGIKPVELATEFLACGANVLLAGLPPADVVKLIRTFADCIEKGAFEKREFHPTGRAH
jgi:hypothetical protein